MCINCRKLKAIRLILIISMLLIDLSSPKQKQSNPLQLYIKILFKIMDLYLRKCHCIMYSGFMEMKLNNCNNLYKCRDISKNHLRLFLFTCDDCPHAEGDERRDQAINHARQLASKNVQI